MRVVVYSEKDVHFDGYQHPDALIVVIPQYCAIAGPHLRLEKIAAAKINNMPPEAQSFRVRVESNIPIRNRNRMEAMTTLMIHLQEARPMGDNLDYRGWGTPLTFLLTRNIKRWSLRWHQPDGIRFKVSLHGCKLDELDEATGRQTAWDRIGEAAPPEAETTTDFDALNLLDG